MPDSVVQRIIKIILSSSIYQFWALQFYFWLFVALISLLSLTMWYGQINGLHVSHTLLQSAIGALLSLPLYFVFMRIWNNSAVSRVVITVFLVLLVSCAWTIIRLDLYVKMTSFDRVWGDFGGWYFGSIFIFFCWSGFFYGIRYYQLLQFEHQLMLDKTAQVKAEQLKRLSAQSIARDAKIKMLRYQLNPHFLCNTLNSINSLIESELSQKAQSMTVQLSKFLRYSLDNNPDTKIVLVEEIKALNLYLEIEKTRFGDRLKVEFQLSEDAKLALIPSLLLQPIIENSMKHVIAQNEEGGTISLWADVVGEKLIIELSDTGLSANIEINQIKGKADRGVGLYNIEERLKVLYAKDYAFNLNIMQTGGLKTIIKLPLERLDENKKIKQFYDGM